MTVLLIWKTEDTDVLPSTGDNVSEDSRGDDGDTTDTVSVNVCVGVITDVGPVLPWWLDPEVIAGSELSEDGKEDAEEPTEDMSLVFVAVGV